jgi:hypothetical protein
MSLLSALNLPTPRHFLPPGGASLPPPPIAAPVAGSPAPTKAADRPNGNGSDDARAEASKLRGAIESRRRQGAELLLRMQKLEPVLKARVEAANGAQKKALAEKQALFAKEMAAAEKAVARAQADLEAIDNPGTKREELLAILARQKAGGKVAEATEVNATGLDPYKKNKIDKDVTTTTTSYADGQAKTETVRTRQKVGLDGYTQTRSEEKAVTDGTTTARASHEKKTNVSLGGKVSTDETKKVEIERADGGKVALETKKSKEISLKGASQTQTATRTNADGSSTSVTAKKGIEREDGKVTATTSDSVTRTGKSGTAVTTEKGASGGFVDGKDGTGIQGSLTGGKSVTTKGGAHVGVVGGLHANVLCKVGEPQGDPKIYPVTVTVSFGASAGVSGGIGKKEGAKVSGSVELKGSTDTTRTVTRHFGEAELAAYTKALAAASKGAMVSAPQKELAAIAVGAQGRWEVARQMWDSGGKGISKKDTDALAHTGDSLEVTQTNTKGGAVKGKAYGVGGGYGKTDTRSSSIKATRNDAGGLDVETNQEHGKQTDLSGSLDVGVVGLEIGNTTVHKTSFGYSIAIDPKQDPDGKILAWLGDCKTEAHYNVFIAANKGKIKVIGRTDGKADAEATNIGVSIGSVKAKIGTNTGFAQQVRTDGQGKVVGKKSVGNSGAGGEFSRWADSRSEQAVAETNEKGEGSLTVTRTDNDKSGSKTKEAVSGLTFGNADLKRLGESACRSLDAWNDWCSNPRDKPDWKAAGIAIVQGKGAPGVVNHALARFLGGDIDRMRFVESLLRGGWNRRGGKAFEFPNSLKDIRADYELVSDDNLPNTVEAFAKKNGYPAASKECARLLAIVDRIQPRIDACTEFANKATKMEMLSELRVCRKMLSDGVQGYAGALKSEDDPKVLAAEGDRLMKLCNSYGVEQERLVDKLNDQDAYTDSERAEGKKLIKQLEDLQYRWRSEFMRLQENYKKRKISLPEFPYSRGMPQIKPTEALVATYEKKFVR